jgi:hypothetical protein
MRFALAALLMAHGVAHLVGFVVPWRLVASQEVAYRTTILASAIDVGDAGIRMLGIVWLLAAAALCADWMHAPFRSRRTSSDVLVAGILSRVVLCWMARRTHRSGRERRPDRPFTNNASTR